MMYLNYKRASDSTPTLMEDTMRICKVSSGQKNGTKNLQFTYGRHGEHTLNITIQSGDLNLLIADKSGFEKLIWIIFPNATIKRFSDYDEWLQFTSDKYIAIKFCRQDPSEYFVVLAQPK